MFLVNGFNKIQSSLIKGDSYFNVFFNYNNWHILTLVKSPREVPGVWLATVFDRMKNQSVDLRTMDGFYIDELGRAQFKEEKDIIPFVEALLNKINQKSYF